MILKENLKDNLIANIKKLTLKQYALLIIAVLLVIISFMPRGEGEVATSEESSRVEGESDIEVRLSKLISSIKGISNVKTFVSINNSDDDMFNSNKQCEIEGIAVIAKGIDDNNNKALIINLIQSLFDVPIHKISVIDSDNNKI